MTNKLKTSQSILPFLFLSAGLVALLIVVSQQTFLSPQAAPVTDSYQIDEHVPEISTPADLKVLLQYLNKLNLNQIDSPLNDNYLDSANL